MVAGSQRGSELVEGGVERFESARVVRVQGFFAMKQMQRGTLFRAGFGEEQRAVCKIKRSQSVLARQFRADLLPMEASRDHEMQHQPVIVVEAHGNTFAKTTKRADRFAVSRVKGRHDGAKQEWI